MTTGTARASSAVKRCLVLSTLLLIAIIGFVQDAAANWVRENAPADTSNVSGAFIRDSLRLLPNGTAVYLRAGGGSTTPTRLARRPLGGPATMAPAFPASFASDASRDSLGLSQPDASGNLIVYRNGNVLGTPQGSFLLGANASPATAAPSPHERINAISMSQSGAAAAILGGGSTASVAFRPAGAGSAFDTPRPLDLVGNQRSKHTGITVDPNGGVFAVYETQQDGGLFQIYAPPGGDFGPPQLLPVPEESIKSGGMEGHYAQSTNGHVIFTWNEYQKTGMNWTVRTYAMIRKPGGMFGPKILISGVAENSGHSVSVTSQGITDDGTAYAAILGGDMESRCPVTNLDGDIGMFLGILPPGATSWSRVEGHKTWPNRTEFGPIVTSGNMVAVGRLDSVDSGARCESADSRSSISVYRGRGSALNGREDLLDEGVAGRNSVSVEGLAVNAVGQVSILTSAPNATNKDWYFFTREARYDADTKDPNPPTQILTRPGKITLSGKVLKATRYRVALPTKCISYGPGDKVACVVNANITSAHEAVSQAKGAISTATASAKSKKKARGKKGKKRQVSLGKVKTRVQPGKTKRVVIKLNKKAKKALKKRKTLPVTLKVTITKKGAKKMVVTRKMKLRAQTPKKARGKAKKKRGRASASSATSSAAVANSSAAKAKPKVTLVKARSKKVVPIDVNRFAYTDRVELACRGNATPLMAGWSAPGGSVGSVYVSTYSEKTALGMMMVAPERAGTFKSWVTCLNRKLKTTYKIGKPAGERVSRVACRKNQVAIGMPVRNAPYYDKNVFSRPIGINGWETNEGTYAAAQVLCLPKRSMRALKLVKRSTAIKVGARTAKISASCKGGRVPISWGFESDAMPENTWRGGSNPVSSPLISQAARQGKKGWSLTFFTPDGLAAKQAGRVAIHLTCARPR